MDASTIRTLSPTTHRQEIYIFGNEKKYLNFSSNDYLNIGTNEHLRNSFLEQILKNKIPLQKSVPGSPFFLFLFPPFKRKYRPVYAFGKHFWQSGLKKNPPFFSIPAITPI